jgi:Domain of unknown function (DUF222)
MRRGISWATTTQTRLLRRRCEQPAPGVGTYGRVDALLDVARVFLNTTPQDRSGEDRTLVVVHVSAENVAGDVPAGTSQPGESVCHIDGVGSTAQRLACDNPVLGAIVDQHGKVLALGRTRRLVSKQQRRALQIRDQMCQYPGCHQTSSSPSPGCLGRPAAVPTSTTS